MFSWNTLGLCCAGGVGARLARLLQPTAHHSRHSVPHDVTGLPPPRPVRLLHKDLDNAINGAGFGARRRSGCGGADRCRFILASAAPSRDRHRGTRRVRLRHRQAFLFLMLSEHRGPKCLETLPCFVGAGADATLSAAAASWWCRRCGRTRVRAEARSAEQSTGTLRPSFCIAGVAFGEMPASGKMATSGASGGCSIAIVDGTTTRSTRTALPSAGRREPSIRNVHGSHWTWPRRSRTIAGETTTSGRRPRDALCKGRPAGSVHRRQVRPSRGHDEGQNDSTIGFRSRRGTDARRPLRSNSRLLCVPLACVLSY
ncbi:hypothetical protein DFJ74DRAFT_501272 [Hyaloraphidium curvatum]|nr:hypothetical protein DFJ74DRAFT_501272 [Hyaloraphidium curvatum]